MDANMQVLELVLERQNVDCFVRSLYGCLLSYWGTVIVALIFKLVLYAFLSMLSEMGVLSYCLVFSVLYYFSFLFVYLFLASFSGEWWVSRSKQLRVHNIYILSVHIHVSIISTAGTSFLFINFSFLSNLFHS